MVHRNPHPDPGMFASGPPMKKSYWVFAEGNQGDATFGSAYKNTLSLQPSIRRKGLQAHFACEDSVYICGKYFVPQIKKVTNNNSL